MILLQLVGLAVNTGCDFVHHVGQAVSTGYDFVCCSETAHNVTRICSHTYLRVF
jgi:hypothetical protein